MLSSASADAPLPQVCVAPGRRRWRARALPELRHPDARARARGGAAGRTRRPRCGATARSRPLSPRTGRRPAAGSPRTCRRRWPRRGRSRCRRWRAGSPCRRRGPRPTSSRTAPSSTSQIARSAPRSRPSSRRRGRQARAPMTSTSTSTTSTARPPASPRPPPPPVGLPDPRPRDPPAHCGPSPAPAAGGDGRAALGPGRPLAGQQLALVLLSGRAARPVAGSTSPERGLGEPARGGRGRAVREDMVRGLSRGPGAAPRRRPRERIPGGARRGRGPVTTRSGAPRRRCACTCATAPTRCAAAPRRCGGRRRPPRPAGPAGRRARGAGGRPGGGRAPAGGWSTTRARACTAPSRRSARGDERTAAREAASRPSRSDPTTWRPRWWPRPRRWPRAATRPLGPLQAPRPRTPITRCINRRCCGRCSIAGGWRRRGTLAGPAASTGRRRERGPPGAGA
jgi:hypothetical protein